MDEKLHLTNASLVITLRCTLKCKLCTAQVPYYDIPPHYSFETIRSAIKNFFKVVEKVDKLTINGGEALTHPQLPEILDEVAAYQSRIGLLEILTNGTVLPKGNLLGKLRDYHVDILVNNYGAHLSTKIPELVQAFQEYGIVYRLRDQNEESRYFGGWVDISDLSLKDRPEADTKALFAKCVYPGAFRCFAIFGDKAYICGVYKRCADLGTIPDNPDEYVDFSDFSSDSDEQKIKKIKDFYNRDFFSSCRYCDGFCSDSPRYLPAEQL